MKFIGAALILYALYGLVMVWAFGTMVGPELQGLDWWIEIATRGAVLGGLLFYPAILFGASYLLIYRPKSRSAKPRPTLAGSSLDEIASDSIQETTVDDRRRPYSAGRRPCLGPERFSPCFGAARISLELGPGKNPPALPLAVVGR